MSTIIARRMAEELVRPRPPDSSPTPFFLAALAVEAVCGVIRWVSSQGSRADAAHWRENALADRDEVRRLSDRLTAAEQKSGNLEAYIVREWPKLEDQVKDLQERAKLWKGRAHREREKLRAVADELFEERRRPSQKLT